MFNIASVYSCDYLTALATEILVIRYKLIEITKPAAKTLNVQSHLENQIYKLTDRLLCQSSLKRRWQRDEGNKSLIIDITSINDK